MVGTVRWNVMALFATCTTKMVDGKTAYDKMFGFQTDGPVIPFGANLSYKPSLPKASRGFISSERRY